MLRDQVVETLVGAAVLAVAAVFLTYSLSAAGQAAGRGYPLKARFAAVDGLNVGADVRVAGVKVGAVTKIELDRAAYDAAVEFRVADGVSLPTDSVVRLKNEGLLGGVYLAIEPGGEAEIIAEGGQFDYGQGSIDVIRLLADFVRQGDAARAANDGE